jgi:hypothetical protein
MRNRTLARGRRSPSKKSEKMVNASSHQRSLLHISFCARDARTAPQSFVHPETFPIGKWHAYKQGQAGTIRI